MQKGSSLKQQTDKWIKEGRGQGKGKDYRPWITVRDFGSQGRSHRIFGLKTHRTHHLLSDLELAVFLLLDNHSDTLDIREQFPLQLEATTQICLENGITHPAYRQTKQVMTSDFLVNTANLNQPKLALQAKYSKDLSDTRIIEKLEIERRYWSQKEVTWKIVTEKEIPKVLTENIKWLYPVAQQVEFNDYKTQELLEFYVKHFGKNPEKSLIEVAKQIDQAYEHELGQSLLEIRYLLAQRYFSFDITQPIRQLKAGQLHLADNQMITEMRRAASQ